MSAVPPAIRRLCLAVDIVGYSGRSRPEQIDVQTRLLWTMVQGCRAAGISPARCDRQDSGDGQILILPSGIDEARVIPDLIGGLLTALHRVNNPAGPGKRIRLRVSMGQGAIQVGQTGFVAPAVVAVCRLLDSDVLRNAIKARPESDAALIVTSDLYDDMIGQGYGGLPVAGFIRVKVDKPEKGFVAEAWLHVPDARPLLASVPAYSDLPDLKRNQQAVIRVLDSQGVQVGSNNVQVNHFSRERWTSTMSASVLAATALAWAVFAGIRGAGHGPSAPDAAHPPHSHDNGTHDGAPVAAHDASGHSHASWDTGGAGLTGDDLGLDGIGDHDGQHDPDWHYLGHHDPGGHDPGWHDGTFDANDDDTNAFGALGYDDPASDSANYEDTSGGTASYHLWDDGGAPDHGPGHWDHGTY